MMWASVEAPATKSSLLLRGCFLLLLTLHGVPAIGHFCQLPDNATQWDPNPTNQEVEVTWGYGSNFTCHTHPTCNGSVSVVETEDMVWISEADRMVVQLIPVELQLGNVLRFSPSQHIGIPFPIEVYKVDVEGFLTCNITRGTRLLTGVPANETFIVPSYFLQRGNNYFITDSDVHPLVSCHMGQRVNVTVKANRCDHQGHFSLCSGWGVCVTQKGEDSFHCSCCGNYRGEMCEIFDSCVRKPCRNGGLCTHESDNFHSFTCNCPLGYYGEFCEHKASDLCELVTCENDGQCVGNSTSFRCLCAPGVVGTHCEVDVNDCLGAPCHNGLCVDQRNGFKCYCEPGYDGHTCQEQLRACELSPCRNGGFCEDVRAEDMETSFRCHCKPGWAGRDCTDKIPACDPNPCSAHGVCSEFNNSFICTCVPGFTGSRCEININECQPNPCHFGGHCKDGINSHSCLCIHSHAGSNCQYTLDMFSPVLDEVDAQGHVVHDPAHMRNLYIVAGCMTGLLITVMLVMMGCYCRLWESCRRAAFNCWPCGPGFSAFWYKKHFDDMVVSVDVTSASDCPLAVDSFWPDPMDTSQLPSHPARQAFGNQTV